MKNFIKFHILVSIFYSSLLFSMKKENILNQEDKERLANLPEELKDHVKKFIYAQYFQIDGKITPKNIAKQLLENSSDNIKLQILFDIMHFLYPYPTTTIQIEIFKSKIDKTGNTFLMKIVDMENDQSVMSTFNYLKKYKLLDQIEILKNRNMTGKNVLMLAIERNNQIITKVILDFIKEFPEISQVEIIRSKDLFKKESSAHLAVKTGSIQLAELILSSIKSLKKEHRNKILKSEDKDGYTPMEIARNYPEIFKKIQEL